MRKHSIRDVVGSCPKQIYEQDQQGADRILFRAWQHSPGLSVGFPRLACSTLAARPEPEQEIVLALGVANDEPISRWTRLVHIGAGRSSHRASNGTRLTPQPGTVVDPIIKRRESSEAADSHGAVI